jgi:hypothetical protein
MGAKFGKVAAGIAVAAAGVVVAVGKMAASAGEVSRDIKNLSALAGTGVEEFQKYAAGSKTVGIEQEKLADIFKDVNDKFGDFIETGAGPLVDFFENIAPAVGVTADQFAKLSGPEALQLYVSSLEKAGVSQQQMTFYMEALASDATGLVPLLANGGAEMRKFGDEAERSGRILSEDMIANGVEMDRKLQALSSTLKTNATKAVLEYSDQIVEAADFITNRMLPAIADFTSEIGDFVESMAPAITALTNFINLAKDAIGIEIDGPTATVSSEGQAQQDAGLSDLGDDRGNSSTGQYYVDADGNVQEYGADTPSVPGITAPATKPVVKSSKTKTKSSGGGSNDDTGERLEQLQAEYETEAALIDAQREEALESLREFRDSKIATEDEYNDLEAQINAEHTERLAQIEREAQQQRMQAVSGALGDLSALMLSENKKLFKIGQAAAIADAVVSGYSAAVSAWEKGMKIGGLPVAAAFTAASLAHTGTLISAISSASATGGSSAVSTSTAGATSVSDSTQERRVAEFRFVGGNVLDPGAIVDAMNEAYDQGYQIRGVIG